MEVAPTRRRRLRFWLGYAVYLAGFCCLVLYGVFALNRARLRTQQRPATERIVPATHMSAGTARRLGFIGPARKGTFQRAPLAKAPGSIRIGCFGDSFTFGAEVAEGLDFPSLLGGIARTTRSDVEVLNFGTSWYGFHQTYLLWQEVGRSMGLDAVVIGPDCFRPERDTTFCHSGATSPYFLHARYVLDGDGVRLEEVEGETFQERFDAYYRFLPRWRYLRFDSNPPLVVAGLVGSSRVLPNPVYYQYRRRSRNEEAGETYARLLRAGSAADRRTPVLLGQVGRGGFVVADASNLAVRTLARPSGFPYLAAATHFGPLGNDLIARQYWALLQGAVEVDLPWISFGETPADLPAAPPLRLEGRVLAELDGRAVGELRDIDPEGGDAGRADLTGSAALLVLASEGVDGPWLALTAVPRTGAHVTVQLDTEDGARAIDLGLPRPVGVATGVWRLPPGPLRVTPNGQVVLETGPPPRGARVAFQGVEVLRSVRVSEGLRLLPAIGRFKRLRALADGFLALDTGSPGGILSLRAGNRRAALASWRVEPRRVQFATPPFRVIP